MSVVPDKQVQKIEFYENHIDPFTTNAVAIGTTAAACTDLATKTATARTKLTAAQVARDAAKDATLELKVAIDAMDIAGAGIIKQVRVKAETTGNPGVYALASIPAPATPTSVGAPGLPYQPKVTLKPNGSIELKWKCNNPAGCTGVIYQVYRKVEATDAYEYLGGTGDKKFVDLTVPSGVSSVTYQVQGTRSTSVGDAADFIVNFGTGTGTTTVTALATPSGKPAKIAA